MVQRVLFQTFLFITDFSCPNETRGTNSAGFASGCCVFFVWNIRTFDAFSDLSRVTLSSDRQTLTQTGHRKQHNHTNSAPEPSLRRRHLCCDRAPRSHDRLRHTSAARLRLRPPPRNQLHNSHTAQRPSPPQLTGSRSSLPSSCDKEKILVSLSSEYLDVILWRGGKINGITKVSLTFVKYLIHIANI